LLESVAAALVSEKVKPVSGSTYLVARDARVCPFDVGHACAGVVLPRCWNGLLSMWCLPRLIRAKKPRGKRMMIV
jgi:hypothetical protein